MADVIYIKYNRTRKEEFQIKTEILREDGALWVEKSALTEAGIPEANIDDCGICTYCESELLFSHRKTKGRRGNFGAFIELV